MRRALLAVVVLAAGGVRAAEPAGEKAPELTRSAYPRLVERIRPSAAEQVWREPAWHTSLGAAVASARAEGKPIFLWAMNGHPLACT
jgi:hypothetical protein